jgi:TetR/AcrR family fatty acid metabolism transcriptional regulator
MEEFSAAGLAAYLEIIRECISDGQKQGIFRSDLNAIICSKMLFGILDEMVTNWILSKKPYELVPLADTVLDVFCGGINK